MRRRIYYRLKSIRRIRKFYFLICFSFIFIQYLSIKLFYWEKTPTPILTRLDPDKELDIDLQSYSVCHPKEFFLKNLTSIYKHSKQQTCFLIEHLDGGPWWSYVTQEFAEILTTLNKLGIRSNVNYRSFSLSNSTYGINLTKYFLNSCQFDEEFYSKNKIPIVILLWDINNILWHEIKDQFNHLFQNLRIRFMVFIDDLHFTTHESYLSRQYLFEQVASEIFSTYAYLFHNYYHTVSPSKITWLPHSASILSTHSINYSAENVLFVSGSNMFEWYPCRTRGFLLCQSRRDLSACLKHPGYGETMKNDSSFHYGGQRYFNYMRKYVFGLGTCQAVHYAIAKLFELPANGLVLVTTEDLIPILEKLHLYHNEHFLTVQCSSVNRLRDEMILLQNISIEKINNIRRKSQDVVHQRHMTQHRAELLHVRLLAQALIATTSSNQERTKWERWGRDCH